MITIYRYPINQAINELRMPNNAQILKVGLAVDDENDYKEKITLWVKVDTDQPIVNRKFLIFGTGADMDETATYDLKYIDTVQKSNHYAFHIFELL